MRAQFFLSDHLTSIGFTEASKMLSEHCSLTGLHLLSYFPLLDALSIGQPFRFSGANRSSKNGLEVGAPILLAGLSS